ncbi:hypothetical protein OG625_00565 [Streptomyces sp. NBC_01351]|uniref:hypothetical protein n=1 Tax=Streptomyces sp. NBC_01351 TaxID=2903833 RepID=UPI002E315849|nr:hypothetical protein [Streptomyces sp. NBC_01351]
MAGTRSAGFGEVWRQRALECGELWVARNRAASRTAGVVFLSGLAASVRVVQPETRERACPPKGSGWWSIPAARASTLRPADTLTVTMLDRLGRNMVELITSSPSDELRQGREDVEDQAPAGRMIRRRPG